VPCAANAVPNAARTACLPCAPNQRAVQRPPNATLQCDFCPEGHMLSAAGVCEPCARSRWQQCPAPLVMDACRGDLHPRMSGGACACGCRQCPFAADAALAGGVRTLPARCALGCARGERLLPGTAGMGARCEKDIVVDALAGGGLFFFSPADSADLALHSCADALEDPAGMHRLEPAVAPHIARANRLQLGEDWCGTGPQAPCPAEPDDAARSMPEAVARAAARAQYWPFRAELGCFFQCKSGFVFVVSPETGAPVCRPGSLRR